jgi:hypothetical protein
MKKPKAKIRPAYYVLDPELLKQVKAYSEVHPTLAGDLIRHISGNFPTFFKTQNVPYVSKEWSGTGSSSTRIAICVRGLGGWMFAPRGGGGCAERGPAYNNVKHVTVEVCDISSSGFPTGLWRRKENPGMGLILICQNITPGVGVA